MMATVGSEKKFPFASLFLKINYDITYLQVQISIGQAQKGPQSKV